MEYSKLDPKNLIAESYEIIGITTSECKSIFLDWALSLSLEKESCLVAKKLHDYYCEMNKDHPMTLLLAEAANKTEKRSRVGRKRRLNKKIS